MLPEIEGLINEAEGARTLNLRIDSPTNGFVSICKQTINERKIKTYDDDGITTVPQQ